MGRHRLSKVTDLKDKKKSKAVCSLSKMDACRGESVR
jgi:flagellar biosynthesis chaperone FliJ